MILKKYIVDSLDQVQEMISKELGPGAVILTSRHIRFKGLKSLFLKNQIEVVAGVDEQEYKNFKKNRTNAAYEANPYDALSKGPGTNGNTHLEHNPQIERPSRKKEAYQGLEEPANYQVSDVPGTYLDPRFNRKNIETNPEGAIRLNYAQEDQNIREQLAHVNAPQNNVNLSRNSGAQQEFEQVVKAMLRRFPPQNDSFSVRTSTKDEALVGLLGRKVEPHFLQTISTYLEENGISPFIASRVQSDLEKYFAHKAPTEQEAQKILENELSSLLETTGPFLLKEGQSTIIILVGPPGSGKTMVAWRLALQYMDLASKKVAVISYGDHRFGNAEKLKSICEEESIAFRLAKDPDELLKTFLEFQSYELVIIDCEPSVRPGTLKIIGGSTHIVLGASSTLEDTLNWLNLYQADSPESLIFTKFDLCRIPSLVMNASYLSRIPVSYYSKGSTTPEDLQIAEPKELVSLLLNAHPSPTYAT